MQSEKTQLREDSALAGALARVGDRWSLLIVEALIEGPLRFGDIQQVVSGIATNVLSQRLRQLEADGVLMAHPYSRRPVRYSYQLTEAGRDLLGAARLLAQWSADHGAGRADTPGHQPCGTPLIARWWCPTCEQVSDPGSEEAVWV